MNMINILTAFFAGMGVSLVIVIIILNQILKNTIGMSLTQAFGLMKDMGGAIQVMPPSKNDFDDFEGENN